MIVWLRVWWKRVGSRVVMVVVVGSEEEKEDKYEELRLYLYTPTFT
jgi:hypothetical protein